ncbi:hypothetical protein [Methanonatronarchaeum thermophilum]|uniref:hypothetical protein n=1 Tax=Methanonatronarchaeum thermophilum TaxID=1927129 RepID=UPI001374716C|nr:hypothetical protein [Methanonatronarchaeum thermophilum]
MNKNRCDGCGNEFPVKNDKCPYCGRKKGHIMKAQNWKCPKCKKMNGPERNNCWNCG